MFNRFFGRGKGSKPALVVKEEPPKASSEDLKVVFVGEMSSGKTALVVRFGGGEFSYFYPPTIGAEYQGATRTVGGTRINYHIWCLLTAHSTQHSDAQKAHSAPTQTGTPGNPRLLQLTTMFISHAACIVVVFDVTDRASYDKCEDWFKLIEENRGSLHNTQVVVVGNKIDVVPRAVPEAEARKNFQLKGLPYFEVSALTGEGVEQLFLQFVSMKPESNENL